jgi:hypothetical protein
MPMATVDRKLTIGVLGSGHRKLWLQPFGGAPDAKAAGLLFAHPMRIMTGRKQCTNRRDDRRIRFTQRRESCSPTP